MKTRDASPQASEIVLKQRFSEIAATTSWLLFALVFLVPYFLVAIILPKQRLIISAETLEWQVPVPHWLEFVKCGWTLNLAEVTRATLKTVPFGAEAAATLDWADWACTR